MTAATRRQTLEFIFDTGAYKIDVVGHIGMRPHTRHNAANQFTLYTDAKKLG